MKTRSAPLFVPRVLAGSTSFPLAARPSGKGKKNKVFLEEKKKAIPVAIKSQPHRSHLGVSEAACPHTLRQACEEQRAANRCGQRADGTERPQKQPAHASTGPGPCSAPPHSLLLCCCKEQTRVQTSCTTHSFLRVRKWDADGVHGDRTGQGARPTVRHSAWSDAKPTDEGTHRRLKANQG